MRGAEGETTTRERILDVAQELLQTEGYHAFSFRDLAGRIGIKSASVHYHFPTKDDLALALLERYHQLFFRLLNEIAPHPPLTRLAEYCDVFIRTFQNGGRICPGASFAADYEALPDSARHILSDFYRTNERWLAATLEEGAASGELRPQVDVPAAAAAIFCALEGAILMGRLTAGRSLEDTRDWVLAMVRRAPG